MKRFISPENSPPIPISTCALENLYEGYSLFRRDKECKFATLLPPVQSGHEVTITVQKIQSKIAMFYFFPLLVNSFWTPCIAVNNGENGNLTIYLSVEDEALLEFKTRMIGKWGIAFSN